LKTLCNTGHSQTNMHW